MAADPRRADVFGVQVGYALAITPPLATETVHQWLWRAYREVLDSDVPLDAE